MQKLADKPGGIEYFISHQIRISVKIRISFTLRYANQWPIDMPIHFPISSFLTKVYKTIVFLNIGLTIKIGQWWNKDRNFKQECFVVIMQGWAIYLGLLQINLADFNKNLKKSFSVNVREWESYKTLGFGKVLFCYINGSAHWWSLEERAVYKIKQAFFSNLFTVIFEEVLLPQSSFSSSVKWVSTWKVRLN